jgi:hypothetical protein
MPKNHTWAEGLFGHGWRMARVRLVRNLFVLRGGRRLWLIRSAYAPRLGDPPLRRLNRFAWTN